MRASAACLITVASIAGAACTTYRTLTPPPPSRVASLNTADDELRISQGVALGFECITAGGSPCAQGQATIDNQNVAKVFPAHINRLEYFWQGTFTPTSYVVVGVSPGETVMRIPGEDPLRIVVIP